MYVCKQLSVNQLEDKIFFCGDKMMCRKIMPVIRNYMEQVDFLSPRIKKYQVGIDQELFLDVVTLVECGL